MTADERIGRLLSRFGQTIEDLPKPNDGYYAYGSIHRKKANYAAKNWEEGIGLENNEDYICHLCDIINRMEIALETAARWMDCQNCEFISRDNCESEDYPGLCDFRIADEALYI